MEYALSHTPISSIPSHSNHLSHLTIHSSHLIYRTSYHSHLILIPISSSRLSHAFVQLPIHHLLIRDHATRTVGSIHRGMLEGSCLSDVLKLIGRSSLVLSFQIIMVLQRSCVKRKALTLMMLCWMMKPTKTWITMLLMARLCLPM